MLKDTVYLNGIQYFTKLITEAELSYNSALFPLFLLVFLCIYFLLRTPRARRNWILAGSLVFYVWSGVWALVIVLATAVIAYGTARKIESIYAGFDGRGLTAKEEKKAFSSYEKSARKWIALAFIWILGLWIAVKAGKLVGLNTVTGLSSVLSGAGIIVPLGISYYTLCMVAYVLDVYWQKTKAEHNFISFCAAVTYFPYIVQGPFCRYQNIMEQMEHLPGPEYTRICHGMQLMIWGYIKKLVIADRLALFTGTIYADPGPYAGVEIALAVVFGAVQIYADFSGCMDIVRGISSAIGIELPLNFSQPFFARSAAEFWRRWHITLGEWTKEYIYLPIAMNAKFMKKGRAVKKAHGKVAGTAFSAFLPLFAVWLFTGLWHGTGWDYLCWGMYWFVLLFMSRITEDFWPAVCKKLHIDTTRPYHKVWQMVRTFLLFAIGRTWTETGSLSGFVLLWKSFFASSQIWNLLNGTIFTYGMDSLDFIVVIIGMAIMLTVDILHEKGIAIRERISRQPIVLRWIIYYAAILVVFVMGIYGSGYDAAAFVYAGF